MDKQDKSRTITIKLSGNEQNYQVTKQPAKPLIIRHDEENIIEESDFSQVAATEELAEDSFEWILPEITDNEIGEYKKINTEKKENKSKPVKTLLTAGGKNKGLMKSVFFAALFAVLLGTSFGIVMLKLVITDKAGPAPGNVVETITKPVQQDPTEKASSSTIGPLTTYIIQEGVYSTKQSALGVAASAEEKGVSAQVTEINGKAYLFLGAADSLDNAKKLGSTYQTLGFTVYAKPFSVAEKELKKISGEEKSFFEKAISLFNGLSASSTAAITDHSLSKDTASNLTGIQKEIKTLKELDLKNEKIAQLRNELEKASDKMKDYQKNGNIKTAIAAQQSLLNFLSLYNSL